MNDEIEKRVARRTAAKNRKSEEADYHRKLVAIMRTAKLLFVHVPSESKATPQYRAKLKGMGLTAGVPDILIFNRSEKYPAYRGFALELKAGTGRVSDAQREWVDALRDQNWAVDVVFSLDEALERLRKWRLI